MAAGAGLLATPAPGKGRPDRRKRAEEVRAEMVWAWSHYRTRAWGKDEIKPVSGGVSSFPLKNHHLGLSCGTAGSCSATVIASGCTMS